MQPSTLQETLKARIEGRAPGRIAAKWRGKRLSVAGCDEHGEERKKVMLNFEDAGRLKLREVKTTSARYWANLPRLCLYELAKLTMPPRALANYLTGCKNQGVWSGAPKPAEMQTSAPGGEQSQQQPS